MVICGRHQCIRMDSQHSGTGGYQCGHIQSAQTSGHRHQYSFRTHILVHHNVHCGQQFVHIQCHWRLQFGTLAQCVYSTGITVCYCMQDILCWSLDISGASGTHRHSILQSDTHNRRSINQNWCDYWLGISLTGSDIQLLCADICCTGVISDVSHTQKSLQSGYLRPYLNNNCL